MATALLFVSGPAFSFDCNAVVNDDAGIFNGNTKPIIDAANALDGAVVRVITTPADSTGNLDNFVLGKVKACTSMQDTQQGVRGNLVVLAISMSPKEVGAYFGDQWKKAFGNTGSTQVQNDMKPYFRSGDFTGGFVAGLKAVRQMMAAALTPPQTSTGPTTIINQAPSDNSWLFWALALIAIGVALFFGIKIFGSASRVNEARRTAQLKAQSQRNLCSNSINGLSDLTVLEARVNAAASAATSEDAAGYKKELATIKAARDSAQADFSSFGQNPAMNPDQPGLSAQEYDEMAGQYGRLASTLKKVEDRKTALDTSLEDAEKAGREAPQKISAAQSAIDAARKGGEGSKAAGFMTAAVDSTLEEAGTLLSQANDFLKNKRAAAAGTTADKAANKANDALKIAQSLPKRKAATTSSLTALSSAIENAKADAAQTRKTFRDIEDNYVDTSWKDIAGNGTEGEKRIMAAEQALKDAGEAAGMNVQDWDHADDLIGKANNVLTDASALFKAIGDRFLGLKDAQAKAPAEIDAAEADIEKASAYITQFGADIDQSHVDALKKASSLLDSAKAELKKKKPDYIAAVKTALSANHAADDILAEAQSEHEAMERKRRQLSSLMDEAVRSINAADSYIRIHSHDVGHKAKELLDDANASYAQANRAGDLDKKLKYAGMADKSADGALAKAKDDVEEEEARIRERNHARESARSSNDFATGVVVGSVLNSGGSRHDNWGSSSSSSSSSSTPSFGSSSDFGGGGSLGGSSSNFGGGGSLGGGSSGW